MYQDEGVIFCACLTQLNVRAKIENCLSDTGGGHVVRWCWVNFQCRGVLLIWIIVGQGPTALAVGAGCLDIFSLVYHFFFLSPSLWETARYRLKYCLKVPLSPKQPTNQLSDTNDVPMQCYLRTVHIPKAPFKHGGGRVVRWSWVNFQCRGVRLV